MKHGDISSGRFGASHGSSTMGVGPHYSSISFVVSIVVVISIFVEVDDPISLTSRACCCKPSQGGATMTISKSSGMIMGTSGHIYSGMSSTKTFRERATPSHHSRIN
jgi:hypothetical protein